MLRSRDWTVGKACIMLVSCKSLINEEEHLLQGQRSGSVVMLGNKDSILQHSWQSGPFIRIHLGSMTDWSTGSHEPHFASERLELWINTQFLPAESLYSFSQRDWVPPYCPLKHGPL